MSASNELESAKNIQRITVESPVIAAVFDGMPINKIDRTYGTFLRTPRNREISRELRSQNLEEHLNRFARCR
jgi:hypothetical protein